MNYAIRIAILYGIVWFIDLLDASILNVALPSIAYGFNTTAPHAEWAIIGFLLALTIAIPLSGWLSNEYGAKKVFLGAQLLYTVSSLACGLAPSLTLLILCRVIQGAAGGLLIPVGMTLLLQNTPAHQWATITSHMNMITLIAPAIGPLLAGYITAALGWRWLFFLKLPLSAICLVLTRLWLHEDTANSRTPFDGRGYAAATISLITLLLALSNIGLLSTHLVLLFGGISLMSGLLFWRIESNSSHPLIPLSIFSVRFFAVGNLIQCAANMIFLGATFVTALYLQEALGFSIVKTGWILAAITPGMLAVLPLIGRYYNRLGPLPFIIPGLLLLSASMFAFLFVTPQTLPFTIGCIIFCEGAASALIQTPNALTIFCEVPSDLKGVGSSLYALGKQLSASIGVALSTMLLAVSLQWHGVTVLTPSSFTLVYLALGAIPLCALSACFSYPQPTGAQTIC